MCYITECNKCHKLTWTGCGRHINQIKNQVPILNRCKCKRWE